MIENQRLDIDSNPAVGGIDFQTNYCLAARN